MFRSQKVRGKPPHGGVDVLQKWGVYKCNQLEDTGPVLGKFRQRGFYTGLKITINLVSVCTKTQGKNSAMPLHSVYHNC
jgi:hypothetical protein